MSSLPTAEPSPAQHQPAAFSWENNLWWRCLLEHLETFNVPRVAEQLKGIAPDQASIGYALTAIEAMINAPKEHRRAALDIATLLVQAGFELANPPGHVDKCPLVQVLKRTDLEDMAEMMLGSLSSATRFHHDLPRLIMKNVLVYHPRLLPQVLAIGISPNIRVPSQGSTRSAVTFALRVSPWAAVHTLLEAGAQWSEDPYLTVLEVGLNTARLGHFERQAEKLKKLPPFAPPMSDQAKTTVVSRAVCLTLPWDAIQVLIDQGGDIHAVNEGGLNALHLAVVNPGRCSDYIFRLIALGLDVHTTTNNGLNVLDMLRRGVAQGKDPEAGPWLVRLEKHVLEPLVSEHLLEGTPVRRRL